MVSLSYWESGRQGATDLPPVLVLHGGPGMDESYMVDCLDMLQSSYHLHYYTQHPIPDDPRRDYSAAEIVAEAVERCRNLAEGTGGPVRLVAHSWGAYLALEVVRTHPELLSHAVLISPVPLSWDRLLKAGERLIARVLPEHVAELERLEALARRFHAGGLP